METLTKEKNKFVSSVSKTKLGKFFVLFLILMLVLGFKFYIENKNAPVQVSEVTKTPQVVHIAEPDPATEKKLQSIKDSIQSQKGSLTKLKQALDVELESDLDLRLESSVF